MITIPNNQLMTAFNDPTFAWELLQWEIAIEMNESLSGKVIAKLLALYMRGVQKMNSLLDVRQSYFKNKLTSLMMKGNVVKSLSKPPPMTKKEKPLEVIAEEKEKKLAPKLQKVQRQVQPAVLTKERHSTSLILLQKKREIEMRLAYQAEQNNRQNLGLMYNEHSIKLQKYHNKVNHLMNGHEESLRERINRRKLKTATFRSRQQDLKDKNSKQTDFEENGEEAELFKMQHRNKINKRINKRFQSLQSRVVHDLTFGVEKTRRVRKFTYDWTPRCYKSKLNPIASRQHLLFLKQQISKVK